MNPPFCPPLPNILPKSGHQLGELNFQVLQDFSLRMAVGWFNENHAPPETVDLMAVLTNVSFCLAFVKPRAVQKSRTSLGSTQHQWIAIDSSLTTRQSCTGRSSKCRNGPIFRFGFPQHPPRRPAARLTVNVSTAICTLRSRSAAESPTAAKSRCEIAFKSG